MDTIFEVALAFDRDGFIQDMGDWDEDTAQHIADLDGLGPLGESQLNLLRQLRTLYLRLGAPPALSHACHLSGLEPDCMRRVFPNARVAWRLAGLPNPGDEAVSYL